ncbi:MAG: hypothetical protein A2W25_04435 [candidate division Zixibacteria bacterium RBG_16_53_22]|nr:MAG: hypothetical protein A2W25_04435 [candidate division Zixibacteria bacterium RBG_16_53_22]
MPKRYVIIGLVLVLCLVILACERMAPPISSEEFIDLASIPASYGSLVSVSTIPAYPEWVQLWFQDSVGTIRVVRVDFTDFRMMQNVRTITRN